MAAWRRAIELSLGDSDVEKLRLISQSRSEPASRVDRARILLGYWKDPSFFAVGQALGLHHQTVQRCDSHMTDAMARLYRYPPPRREARHLPSAADQPLNPRSPASTAGWNIG